MSIDAQPAGLDAPRERLRAFMRDELLPREPVSSCNFVKGSKHFAEARLDNTSVL